MILMADTVELKFRPMFKEFPGKVIGLYGEAFGYSVSVVVGFAKALEAEYDSLTEHEKGRVHRVANYFMNPSSPLRSQISTLAELKQPIAMFPRLRRELQEYAFALLVAHSLEGLHRQIKCYTSSGKVVRPALACARVRGTELSRLSDHPHFVKFASKFWNATQSRSIINTILLTLGTISKTRLFRMSLSQKAAKLYSYDEESQFEDTQGAAAAIAIFRVHTRRNLEVEAEVRTAAESALVTFYKSGFVAGRTYSVASHLLKPVVDRHPLPLGDIPAVLQAALAVPVHAEPDHHSRAAQTFFEVIDCHPEAKTVVRTTHTQKVLTRIRCMLLELVGMDAGRPVFSSRADLSFDIDLMNWASAEAGSEVASSLRVWEIAHDRLHVMPIQGPVASLDDVGSALGTAARESPVDLSEARPIASLLDDDDSIGPELEGAIVPAPAGEQRIVRRLLRDEVGDSFIDHMWHHGSFLTEPLDKWMGLGSLEGVDSDCLHKLLDDGVLIQSETDDCHIVYSVDATKLHLEVRTVLHNPDCFVDHVACSEQGPHSSKVGFMAMLLKQGWLPQLALAPSLSPDVHPHFSASSLSKSKWFWLAMVMSEQVFVKLADVGLSCIQLHMPGG
jgi:hypothetical protein